MFVAGIMDGIDGRVARLTGTSSAFGVQYDSLADLVSFGLAPALVMYHWSLSALKFDGTLGRVGWAVAFLYRGVRGIAPGPLQYPGRGGRQALVRRPGQPGGGGPDDVLRLGLRRRRAGLERRELRYVALGVTLAAALLMVSQIRYWSFKGSGEGGPRADRVPFAVLLVVPVAIAVLVIDPPRVLLAVGVLYALSGPADGAVAAREAAGGQGMNPGALALESAEVLAAGAGPRRAARGRGRGRRRAGDRCGSGRRGPAARHRGGDANGARAGAPFDRLATADAGAPPATASDGRCRQAGCSCRARRDAPPAAAARPPAAGPAARLRAGPVRSGGAGDDGAVAGGPVARRRRGQARVLAAAA